MVTSKKIDSC